MALRLDGHDSNSSSIITNTVFIFQERRVKLAQKLKHRSPPPLLATQQVLDEFAGVTPIDIPIILTYLRDAGLVKDSDYARSDHNLPISERIRGKRRYKIDRFEALEPKEKEAVKFQLDNHGPICAMATDSSNYGPSSSTGLNSDSIIMYYVPHISHRQALKGVDP